MKVFKLEKDFQKWLLAELRRIPYSWFYSPPTRSVRGIPDILGCIGGIFISLELKRDKAARDSSRENLQKYVSQKIADAGGLSWDRVTPNTVEKILLELRDISRKHHLTQG